MSPEELITYYFDKKSKKELTKAEIKSELEKEHGFDSDTIKSIMIEISNRELYELENQKSPIERFLSSIGVSYFFLIFGIVVIIVSIFILQTDITSELNKILPWVLILGALFMLFKHGAIIFKHKKEK